MDCKPSPGEAMPADSSEREAPAKLSDPAIWVDEHGDYLFQFALARVRDQARAEDLVQETFLAALKARENFAGRSNERTWLAGILKFKILDHFRRAFRETPFTDLAFYAEEERTSFVQAGVSEGAWIPQSAPVDWPAAGENLDRQAFWEAFHACSNKLPKSVATVFILREVDGLEGKEICATLNLSENNYWVMMHRARMALRRCLELNWFTREIRS